jgi:Domain of Unknown Function (DUF1080)
MKKIILMLGFVSLCSFIMRAQTTGVQFGETTQAEATIEKVAPLLEYEGLGPVEALCNEVATNGLTDALVRTKLFMLGQAVVRTGGAKQHHEALEALYLRFAKESASPVQQLFFIEQLRWMGTERSLSVIKELASSKDVHVAASATMTRQAIEGKKDPETLTFPATKMLKLKESLAKAKEADRFNLLVGAVQTKGELDYQASAIRNIEQNLSPASLDKWFEVTRSSDDPRVVVLLLRAIGTQKSDKVAEFLVTFCGHSDMDVVMTAIEVIAKHNPSGLQKALPVVLTKVDDTNYKTFLSFMSTLPIAPLIPIMDVAYPQQQIPAKRLILETFAPYTSVPILAKESLNHVVETNSDTKLATAAFRYLRQHADATAQEKLFATLTSCTGSLQSEAVQAYAAAARRPGNECYGVALLQAMKAEPNVSEAFFDTAGRIGTSPLLTYVASLSASNKNALRTLSTWRDGLAAPILLEQLAQKPADALLLKGVRQQLQSTQASSTDLMKAYKTLEATGTVTQDNLKEFKKLIDVRKASEPKTKMDDEGFTILFDGADLDAWIGNKITYRINENKELLVDPPSGGKGDLYTADEYGDFIFRFEFKLTPGANNGIGVRTPQNVDAAYEGFEIQVLDDTAPKYANLLPTQYHGSVYKIIPAKKGSQKNIGEWNSEEIIVNGRHIKVTVNGKVIVDANVDESALKNKVTKAKHPGLNRTMGHISLCGHGDKLWYRNIKVKPIVRPDNTPSPGWTPLFNGKDLTNWKGVTKKETFDNPLTRAAAKPEKRAEMQKIADEDAKLHWTVKDGVLCFDGKGFSLATVKDYANFEMWCDWRLLTKKGDSGIYLRGSPQVQIWDAHNQWKIGSGGLYNNKKNPSQASMIADNPIGEWNTFYIRMIGEKVDVYLNGKRVVDNVTLENFWDRKLPIFPKEQIELQCHGDPIEFKNIFIREL